MDLEHGQHYLLLRGILLYFWLHSAGVKRPPLLLSVLHETTPFLTASEEGSSDGCPVGSHVLKKKRRRWREEIQFQGMYVHEEQEDVEIVKVDCMCVKKE